MLKYSTTPKSISRIPAPLMSVHRISAAAVPYCALHRDAFLRRFRLLKIVQYVLIAGFFGFFFAGAIMEKNEQDWNYLMVLGLLCILSLPITLVVRHFLYDAFFRFRTGGVLVSSRHGQFIENLAKVNPEGQVVVVGRGP